MLAPMLATLWIGPSLGAVERACLRSAMRQGHAVSLFSYGPVQGVPAGVALRDAAEIVPRARIVRHHTGSVALFANLFRYTLLQREAVTWIDADLYVIKPIDGLQPYLFGRQSEEYINSAALRLPGNAPIIARLIAMFDERRVPGWLHWRQRLAAYRRRWATGKTGLAEMPWGTAGPHALTEFAKKAGLIAHALPQETFYPVSYERADWILDPATRLEDVVAPETVAVHLWNEVIKGYKDKPAPAGSFLARLQEEGA